MSTARILLRFTLLCLGLLLPAAAAVLIVAQPYVAGARPARSAVRPADMPQWGDDIVVNSVVSGTRELLKNYSMAANPASPNTLLASYEYANSRIWTLGYALSTDSGHTWANNLHQEPWGDGMSPQSNSSVAYDSQGVAYYMGQAVSSTQSGYFVLTSTDGLAWGTPVPVAVEDYNGYRDQARLAVDPRTSGQYAGSVYAAWRYFRVDFRGLQIKYSRDGGATWSQEIGITDLGHDNVFGPALAIASNGKLYAAFQQLDAACWCNVPRLYLDSSTDGGQTWGLDHLITGQPISATGALDLKGRELILLGDDHGGELRINHFPSIAVAPNDPNTVYVAWNDGRWDTPFTYYVHDGKHGDIAFSRTTDGGQTWSAPMRINDDPQGNGVDQWRPNLAVAPDGTLAAVWYDRRMDPNGYLYDLFYSQSTDGGLTWSANQRISDSSSDPVAVTDYKGVGDIGNYNSLVAGPDYVMPSWSDTRRLFSLDFYVDRAELHPSVSPSPTPSATRTSIPTFTATDTGTATTTATATFFPTATPTTTPCDDSFSDVQPTDYFHTAVRYLACHGIISGYADGTFRPYNNTTRAQLSKIVVLAEGWQLACPQTGHFSDVPTSNPFYCYIETAYVHGIISGYADGTFRWGNNVTRGQLCKIIVLAEGWTDTCPQTGHFSDVPPADPFFCNIEAAYSRSIISGYADGTFRPGNPATRGQISKIVYQAITAP